MIRSFRAAVAGLLLAVAGAGMPAFAQTYTLPEIGLQNSGSCPQLAVKERGSKTNVPLGCLDVASKHWKLSPGEVRQEGQNVFTPATPLYSAVNTPEQVAQGKKGPDNFTLSATSWAFRYYGGPDFGNTNSVSSQRAIRCTTVSDWRQYEACDNIDFYSRTGYVDPWKASTAYAVGDVRYNGDFVYRVTTAGTSAASGGPNATSGTNIVDGSVRWTFEGTKFSDAKVGWSLGAVAYSGSGDVWGMNPNLVLGQGFKSKAYAMEIDLGNNSGVDYTFGGSVPGAEGIWLGGAYQNTSLGGMTVGGFPKNPDNTPGTKPMFLFGYWCKNAYAAGDTCYQDWSNAKSGFSTASFANKTYDFQGSSNSQIGFFAEGNKATAGVLSRTAGPVGVQVEGNNTFAAFADTGSAPISVNIQGSHSTGGIVDKSTSSNGYRSQGTYSYSVLNLQEAQGSGATYGLTLKEGQRICFTGQDGCFGRANGKLYYSVGGVNQFAIEESTGNLRVRGNVVTGVTP